MIRIRVPSLALLRRIVERTGVPGVWVQRTTNYHQFYAENLGVLNWWESTGAIFFQGRNPELFEFVFLENISANTPETNSARMSDVSAESEEVESMMG
jgi:hypothetical protein